MNLELSKQNRLTPQQMEKFVAPQSMAAQIPGYGKPVPPSQIITVLSALAEYVFAKEPQLAALPFVVRNFPELPVWDGKSVSIVGLFAVRRTPVIFVESERSIGSKSATWPRRVLRPEAEDLNSSFRTERELLS
jgi:hypothetical protein